MNATHNELFSQSCFWTQPIPLAMCRQRHKWVFDILLAEVYASLPEKARQHLLNCNKITNCLEGEPATLLSQVLHKITVSCFS